jgi:SecD/SecF fusion protein
MKRYTHWVLIALVVIIGVSVWSYMKKGLQLGLDLKGGSVLTYRIDTSEMSPTESRDTLKNTVKVFRKRVDTLGLGEISIEQVGATSIRISLPGREQAEVRNIKDILQKLGKLEFRILARDGDPTEFGPLDIQKERDIFAQDPINYEAPKSTDKDYPGFQWIEWREQRDRPYVHEIDGRYWSLARIDRWEFTGDDLEKLNVRQHAQKSFEWIVLFGIKDLRENDFGDFTGPNSDDDLGDGNGRPMAIVLDGKIDSAPNLLSRLTDGGYIEGDFDLPEAEALVNVLLSGSLEVKPELESEYSVGPSLGEDAIKKGVTAIAIGFLLVVAVLLYYYLVQGLIANFALVMNLAILIGILSFLSAALTLPGMAGIVLTVGMAVDANILIYERIREEKAKGKTLLQAVKNGYDRAFLTIFDANLTTIITAFILYFMGTGPVQGFAVTLIIGILASMFTALVVSRLIVETLIGSGILKDIRFTRLLLGNLHTRYMKLRPLMIGVSLLLVVGGLGLFVSRGEEKFDIDFTGGAEVHLRFREPVEITEVRDAVTNRYPDASVVTVKSQRVSIEHLNLDRQSDWFTVKAKVRSDAEKAAFEQHLREAFAGRLMPKGVSIRPVDPSDGEYERKHLAGHRLDLHLEETVSQEDVREILREAGEEADTASVLDSGSWDPNDSPETVRSWIVYFKAKRGDDAAALGQTIDAISRAVDGRELHVTEPVPATTFIGSLEAQTISTQALMAIIYSLLAQILYIAFRFKGFSFGFAAVIALIHDVSVTLGIVAFVDMTGLVDVKINLPIIAAFLTLIGYSMNDTIVVFDRIRENRQRWKGSFSDLIDTSVNQNLVRTLRTSFTTFLVLAVIFVVNRGAASVLEGFSFVMLAGVITGTYSSIFIASPMLMFLPWYWRKFHDIVIAPLWKNAGGAKWITWPLILAALIATPVWILIALVAWLFIPDADRALNLALRAEGGAA